MTGCGNYLAEKVTVLEAGIKKEKKEKKDKIAFSIVLNLLKDDKPESLKKVLDQNPELVLPFTNANSIQHAGSMASEECQAVLKAHYDKQEQARLKSIAENPKPAAKALAKTAFLPSHATKHNAEPKPKKPSYTADPEDTRQQQYNEACLRVKEKNNSPDNPILLPYNAGVKKPTKQKSNQSGEPTNQSKPKPELFQSEPVSHRLGFTAEDNTPRLKELPSREARKKAHDEMQQAKARLPHGAPAPVIVPAPASAVSSTASAAALRPKKKPLKEHSKASPESSYVPEGSLPPKPKELPSDIKLKTTITCKVLSYGDVVPNFPITTGDKPPRSAAASTFSDDEVLSSSLYFADGDPLKLNPKKITNGTTNKKGERIGGHARPKGIAQSRVKKTDPNGCVEVKMGNGIKTYYPDGADISSLVRNGFNGPIEKFSIQNGRQVFETTTEASKPGEDPRYPLRQRFVVNGNGNNLVSAYPLLH